MMLDLVRDSVTTWRTQTGGVRPRDERIVSLDVTRGVVDGTCYLVFENACETPALVAKVARTEAGKAIFRTEFETLRTLDQIGMNTPNVTTPLPLLIRETDHTLVALQSALPGASIKNLPGRQVFSAETAEATIQHVLDWWQKFQACYGVRVEPLTTERYERAVIDPIEKFRSRYLLEDDEQRFLDRRFVDERRLEGVGLPWMARHGDFCTANMILRPEGVGVFDWEFSLERKLPLFDLFFFFASTRFPYSGASGESGHMDSFVEIYWGQNYLREAVRSALERVCQQHAVPRESLADLFLISLIEVANMKFEAQLEGHGMTETPASTDVEKRRVWERFSSPGKDAPLACIRRGVFRNLRQVVRHGDPRF